MLRGIPEHKITEILTIFFCKFHIFRINMLKSLNLRLLMWKTWNLQKKCIYFHNFVLWNHPHYPGYSDSLYSTIPGTRCTWHALQKQVIFIHTFSIQAYRSVHRSAWSSVRGMEGTKSHPLPPLSQLQLGLAWFDLYIALHQLEVGHPRILGLDRF